MNKEEKYLEMLLKIKEVYENGSENDLDELLHGMFTNEFDDCSY